MMYTVQGVSSYYLITVLNTEKYTSFLKETNSVFAKYIVSNLTSYSQKKNIQKENFKKNIKV